MSKFYLTPEEQHCILAAVAAIEQHQLRQISNYSFSVLESAMTAKALYARSLANLLRKYVESHKQSNQEQEPTP